MGLCQFAVDLLNWRKNNFHRLKNFIYRCFFGRWLVELDYPRKLFKCGNTLYGVYHFAVDLLKWEKIYFSNSKISYIGVFLAVDLLICTFLPKISEYGGMSFCCWLVELKKIYFTNSKISYTGVFCPLTCWMKLSCLKMPNVEVCHIAVDLLNWEKIFFTNSKISYTGVFLSVDLLNWAFVAKISEFGGSSFSCWLVELRKNLFHQLKNFIYRCFFGRWLVELDFPA